MVKNGLYVIILSMIAACPIAANPPDDGFARAGQPQEISRFARPFDGSRMIGYPIGGGALNRHKAEAPNAADGTWGLDYSGWLIQRRVDLGWWHGRRYQGGAGAYKTDGPKIINGD